MIQLTGAQVRYLLAIYRLGEGAHDVRCTELARTLGVTRPSVVKMLAIFQEKRFVVQERYGQIYLTDTGFLAAKQCMQRLEKTEQLLREEFDLTEQEALDAVCALAAVLPERCFEKSTAGVPDGTNDDDSSESGE